MIPQFIDELLSRVDLVDVIGASELKRTGQRFSALCPFHEERSPSFSVNQDNNFTIASDVKAAAMRSNLLWNSIELIFQLR